MNRDSDHLQRILLTHEGCVGRAAGIPSSETLVSGPNLLIQAPARRGHWCVRKTIIGHGLDMVTLRISYPVYGNLIVLTQWFTRGRGADHSK